MRKLKEEIFRAYTDISHSSKSEEIVDAIVEVSKKYIEKAFDAGEKYGREITTAEYIIPNKSEWLKENIE